MKIALGPGYQVPMAAKVRAETGIITSAVGLIVEPAQADAIISSGQADCVALARAFLDDPRWVWHAAERLGAPVSLPPAICACLRSAMARRGHGASGGAGADLVVPRMAEWRGHALPARAQRSTLGKTVGIGKGRLCRTLLGASTPSRTLLPALDV